MRKWLYLILFSALLLLPLPARAQSATKLSSLDVDLRPEYDKPSMLIIYRLTLSPSVSLPTDLSVRIPVEAGKPNAVAARQVDGTLIYINYTQQSSGSWTTVKLTATMPEIQVEYYDPRLTRQGNTRHFEFTWPGDFDIDALNIQVQQPYNATDMRISPSMNGTQGSDGLTYYTAPIGSLKSGQTFKITMDYQKPDDSLSIEHMEVKTSQPVTSNNPIFSNFTSVMPYILLILGVILVLVAVGILLYWQFGKRDLAETPRRRKRTRAMLTDEEVNGEPGYGPGGESREAVTAGGSIYCPQCGRRASSGDRFCRSCGSRLRQE